MAAGDGLIVMQPTSIVVAGAGSSASINSDGGVDFTSATSLSLNGVFTSSFDNYLIVMRHFQSFSNSNVRLRLRVAGSDNSTASSYTLQYLLTSGASIFAARSSDSAGWFTYSSITQRSGNITHIYGPALAQPTVWRTVTASGHNNAETSDFAVTHNQSTAYDGFTLYPELNDQTGNVAVFGYEE